MTTKLYFAYGANLNIDNMAHRCPKAVPVAGALLHDHKLVFRNVADVVPAKGHTVAGALWRITPECELALDRFEGYPILYGKRVLRFPDGEEVMMYVMNNRDVVAPPSPLYLQTIREGYRDFNLDPRMLRKAVEEARRQRRGRVIGGQQWATV